MKPVRGGPTRSHGFTYLGVLFIVSLLAMTSAMASVVWSTAQQRDNERELVFVGRQFEAAIERYRARSTNPAALYPRRLDDLLRDDRLAKPLHHLRRIYLDPMTGDTLWGLIRLPDGGIVGVHSLSERAPFPRKVVVAGYAPPPARTYRDWRFIAPSAIDLVASAAPIATAASASRRIRPPPTPREIDTSTPAEPETPGLEPAAERAQRPTPEEYRSRTPEACSRIAAFDEQSCRQHAARAGDDAGRECQDSAVQRGVACALGTDGALPPLSRRNP